MRICTYIRSIYGHLCPGAFNTLLLHNLFFWQLCSWRWNKRYKQACADGQALKARICMLYILASMSGQAACCKVSGFSRIAASGSGNSAGTPYYIVVFQFYFSVTPYNGQLVNSARIAFRSVIRCMVRWVAAAFLKYYIVCCPKTIVY